MKNKHDEVLIPVILPTKKADKLSIVALSVFNSPQLEHCMGL